MPESPFDVAFRPQSPDAAPEVARFRRARSEASSPPPAA